MPEKERTSRVITLRQMYSISQTTPGIICKINPCKKSASPTRIKDALYDGNVFLGDPQAERSCICERTPYKGPKVIGPTCLPTGQAFLEKIPILKQKAANNNTNGIPSVKI